MVDVAKRLLGKGALALSTRAALPSLKTLAEITAFSV
jgi:hypothetical protein